MQNSTTIIIMGVTGDLATKNLIPALYELFAEKKELKFSLIGVAKNAVTQSDLIANVRPFLTQFDQQTWDAFIKKSYFLAADITNPESYKKLAALVKQVENTQECNRIVYCACPPQLFLTVAHGCVDNGIIEHEKNKKVTSLFHTIVFEKPFGTNSHTAQELNDALQKLVSDNQIVRADHYLAKELVETIAYVRFTNEIFEPLWNNNHIEYVLITLKETATLEKRAGLYDTVGVVRDVIQSHALQLLSLVAMQEPATLEGKELHKEKLAILKKTTITHAIFGQYVGYAAHAGVKPQSTTPTYALITYMINTPGWENVPFVIQAGKALDTQSTEIKIVFKQPACKLSTGCPMYHNELIVKIAPRGEFELSINIKKPDSATIMPITLDFCYSCMWPYTPQAYRVIFEKSMNQTLQSLSVPFAEIERTWEIVEPIINNQHEETYFYEIGSAGPLPALNYLEDLRSNHRKGSL